MKDITINDAIACLEKKITNPSMGLPEEIFLFVSKLTPMVNIDLLIKDENERVLLAWRDDQYCGTGWHVPGGIIRYTEDFEERLLKVSKEEIGVIVEYDSVPIAINQIIDEKLSARGHFISILFKCFLSKTFVPTNDNLTCKDAGYLMWHDHCPKNLIKYQEIYKKYL